MLTDLERMMCLILSLGDALLENQDILSWPSDKQLEFAAQYLLSNGVILPPCKIGDKLYVAYESKVTGPWVCEFPEIVKKIGVGVESLLGGFKVYTPDDFGNTVFLTREDAEAAIRKRKEVQKE